MSTIVLLHGFGGCRQSWRRVVEALPGDNETVAIELLGHHERGAQAAQSDGSFEGEVSRVEGLIAAAAGGRQVHLVGYSLGARVALGLLCSSSVPVTRATLVGVNPGLSDDDQRRQRRRSDGLWAAKLESAGDPELVLERFFHRWQGQELFASQRALSPAGLEEQRRLRSGLCPAGLARAMRTLSLGAMPDYGARLDELDIPVELVVGERDAKFRGLAEQMLARIRRSTLRVVPGVGHNVVLEAPEHLAEIIGAATLAAPGEVRG